LLASVLALFLIVAGNADQLPGRHERGSQSPRRQ